MSRDRGAEEPEFESGYTGWTSEERDRVENAPDLHSEANCVMCDTDLYWSVTEQSWRHSIDRSVYCPGKTSSVAMPEDDNGS